MWSRWPTWVQVVIVVFGLVALGFAGYAIKDTIDAATEAERAAAEANAEAAEVAAEEETKTSRWGAIGEVAGAVAGIIALCLV